jgi:hypothetical protein
MIAKTEIPVSVLVALEVGDFSPHPEDRERFVDQLARSVVEICNAYWRFA